MKYAIITGGSRGLGNALLYELENDNYQIIEFSRTGSTKYNIRCDFNHYEQASLIVEEVIGGLADKTYSELMLINNAGVVSPIGPISQFSPDQYSYNVNINFLSSILLTGVFTKYFQSHNCRKTIIAVSSGAARKSKYGWSLYCGVKAGVEMFYSTYSLEQAKQEFPINAIVCDPGIIDTEMQRCIRNTPEKYFPEKGRFIKFKDEKLLKTPEFTARQILVKCHNTLEKYIKI